MSRTVDERVVEMRFDNKQFEAGAKQTVGTLSRLKEALELPDSGGKALEGLDKAIKGIKLDGLSAGVEALEKRFSTMGIVGMRVIENITDGLMSKLYTAVNFVTNSIVSGGIKRAMNIENAHFQLQALLKDEAKVQAVMADAMESVDGTAYAYDEAAKAASQFAASGIQAGEEMLGALKGITGVAAMTNSSFEDVSRIFTTVAGNGRLMGDQLLQLSSRGLNAASTLADYFREVRGQANMTEGEIREMVSKGKISFKDFSDAMTWAFGDSAKRANETFTGAMSNMKSALARIGAGFISPLVEQNGELVQLFNALRIKINDVKSALVFDEQRSAISGLTDNSNLLFDTMTKIVKNGSVGFDEVTSAILGTTKSEEELSKINSKLTESFEEVKETGYASSEVLMKFTKNGINAYGSLQSYINGILDGTIRVSDATKDTLRELTNGIPVSIKDIDNLAKEGKISFDTFSEAIIKTSGIVETETKFTSDTIKNMISEVKASGSVTTEALMEFRKNGMNAYTALRDYMNGVLDGSVRASYATKQAIEEITEGTSVGIKDIENLTKEGKISFDIFQSAMEKAYGTEKTLSKQFTDTFQDMIKNIVKVINETDVTKPMEIFYYWVESVKNVTKGLLSVINPVAKAFGDVFFVFNPDDIITFSEAIEELTAKMKLSEKGSQNLHDAFEGVFSVTKLVVDIFFELFGAIVPINKPVLEMGDGFLGLVGSMGRTLTSFTKMIRSCTLLRKAFGTMSGGFSLAMDWLTKLIRTGKNFISALSGMEGTVKLIDSITYAFTRLSKKASPYVEDFIETIEYMFKDLFKLEDININQVLEIVSQAFSDLSFEIDHFSFKTVEEAFDSLKKKIKKFNEVIDSNNGIVGFIKNTKKYGKDLKDALSWDSIMSRMEKIMDVFGKFFNWIKNVLEPSFKEFNVGTTVAAGGGIGIIYAMIKAAKAFEKISNSITVIPDFLRTLKGTLTEYQNKLKAEALLKIATAIAVFAGALVILSFVDPDRLGGATAALTIAGGALILAFSVFISALNKGKELNNAAMVFAKGLSSTMKKLGRAVEIAAIGNAVKDFAKSIAIIALSIIGLGLMWRKDPEAFDAALKVVAGIAGVLSAVTILMILGSRLGDPKKMASIGVAILAISASLGIIVLSISKLMKMKLPEDYDVKLFILAGIIAGLAGLAIALGIAAKFSGGNDLPNIAKAIGSLAVLLVATVISLKMLFEINLPPDYGTKLLILGGIFTGFAALLIAMGIAARISKGNGLKAAATILAMSVFLAVVVASLFVLTLIPTDKMLKGAIALGIVLTTLGVALYGAGKITNKNTYKSIIAMAITVGVVAGSLAILSLIPIKKLMASAIALGAILLILNEAFKTISNGSKMSGLVPLLAMIGTMLIIAGVLYELAEQPWEGMLASGAALSVTMLAFSKSFDIILKKNWSKNSIKKVGIFLLLTLAVIPIGIALYKLAEQPWENLLGAAAALSLTILGFSVAFDIILKKNWSNNSIKKIGIFGLLVLATIPVAIMLYKLAEQPWENLLGAAISLSTVLLAMSGALAILTIAGNAVGPAIIGIALLDVLIADLALVLWALGNIFKSDDAKELLSGGLDILVLLGKALGDFVGAIIGGIITGISSSLPQIGLDLSAFMTNLQEFLNGAKNIDGSTLASIGFLAATLIALTAAEVIAGLASLFGLSLIPLAAELSGFMIGLTPFILISRTIKPESMEACKSLAEMIIILTSAQLLSGIGRFFGLTGKLSDFAAELNAFAPAIADFAEKVKDVKPEAVEGAAAAASIMAEVAGKLQGHGGIFQKIVGEKNLAAFAEELNAFAPAIAEFSEQVKDVDPASVEGAKSAAMIMAEVANKLPNSGGLSAKIFGDNKLSDFGRELAAFASYVPFFIQAFSNVSPFSVIGVAAVTEIMSTLANGLPNSGGVVSWFTGDNDISKFGQKLVSFGENVKKFSDSVTEIDETKISSVVEEIKKLVALTTEISSLKDSEISSFAVVLIKTGSSGIDGLVKTFTDSKKKVEDAVEIMIKYLTEALKSKYFDVYRAGITIIEHLLSAINNGNSDFYKAGSNAGEGFIKGLNDKVNSARNAGAAIGKAAYEALKKSLDEHSPSKKTAEAGLFAGEGFINALLKYVSEAYKTGSEIGEESIKGINYGIESLGINNSLEPTIKPIMDLSDIRRNADEITSLFNSSINVTKGYALSASVDFVKRDDKYQELMNQTKGMISDMNSRYEDQVKQVSKSIDKLSKRPINVSVSLEGEAAGVFKLVRQENDKFIETAHYNPLSKTTVTTRRS